MSEKLACGLEIQSNSAHDSEYPQQYIIISRHEEVRN